MPRNTQKTISKSNNARNIFFYIAPALLAGVAVAGAAAGAAISKVIGAQQPVTPLPPAPTPFGLPSAEMMPTDVEHIAGNIGYHAKYSAATTPLEFNTEQAYRAYANSVQERLVERWDATYDHFEREDPKMAYYISMEYLMGRTLSNAVRNIGLQGPYADALEKFGKDFEELEMTEKDAGLGNGGLGRLAACFLDSIATLNLPAWGYGLRYKYGLFKQGTSTEGQFEMPEDWLDSGNPFEVRRDDLTYPIRFFGEVDKVTGEWKGGEEVVAVAYDNPVPGYGTNNTINLRLWSTDPLSTDFDLPPFNAGEHLEAQEKQMKATEICAVLYPGDDSLEGKALRLRQQYLLCSATVQDIVATFKRRQAKKGLKTVNWNQFGKKCTIQMNDTHPTMAAPELIRILMDQEGLNWTQAMAVAKDAVNYTNHTVLPEALEKWPLSLMDAMLPRHMQIIRRIDEEFMATVKPLAGETKADAESRIAVTCIIEEPKPATGTAKAEDGKVRMANLCVIMGKYVNGVAALHTEIVKADVFNDFYKMYPEKFQNKTNGVTPRRWLAWCNPSLSAVITKWLGTDAWIKDLTLIEGLKAYADNKELHAEWRESKLKNKLHLLPYIEKWTGIHIDEEFAKKAMFDVQIKRIHEYKRQLMNIMSVVYKYKQLKAMSKEERAKQTPRFTMIGGKAFATYTQAKRIVRLCIKVSEKVNNDPDMKDVLRVAFVPNYNVTAAELLIPAAELTQQISTAGMEASGTSNMKFMMNGSLTVGTLDGANVEIRECVGPENFFLFGAVTEDVPRLRAERARGEFVPDPRFTETKEYIKSGIFGGDKFEELMGSLEGNEGFGVGDYFIVGHDFPSYLDAQAEADKLYQDQDAWDRASVIQAATSAKFSSDRTIDQYATEIWDISPCPVPGLKDAPAMPSSSTPSASAKPTAGAAA